ncbi:hypothetical protein BRAS3809_7010002 [Bradyrhizobium sp. STM 3809]|nr:hypothetical protein BRAS3809_7010002 [Bradyrhizobium sp. STM 3809]
MPTAIRKRGGNMVGTAPLRFRAQTAQRRAFAHPTFLFAKRVIASAAKQSRAQQGLWIASLRSQ